MFKIYINIVRSTEEFKKRSLTTGDEIKTYYSPMSHFFTKIRGISQFTQQKNFPMLIYFQNQVPL